MTQPSPVLFFDGECVLCNGAAAWVFKRERTANLHFASLQGETADQLRTTVDSFPNDLDSFVLLENGTLWLRSRAAIRVARFLRFPYNLFAIFRVVPAFISDRVYDFVAQRRLKWFGKTDRCWVPPVGAEQRFLP